ncbi:MAG: class I SAM-dependent methyltransferase [Pseudomonadota bacterium]
MPDQTYLMENDEEILRLKLKTDEKTVRQQATWAGIKEGMRVADIGCGAGITTSFLHRLTGDRGEAVGIDMSRERIEYAKNNYGAPKIKFVQRDITQSLSDLGLFDFIWVRFFLEYHRTKSFDIVKSLTHILKPGGIICLIDLDYNCLNHFGLSDRLKQSMLGIMSLLEKHADFDPYAGIKLYSFLYDLNYMDIEVSLAPHHLIYGELNQVDAFNWIKKIEIAGKNSGYKFEEYKGGYEEFFEEFKNFFSDPRRFTYTPIISCRGIKRSGCST